MSKYKTSYGKFAVNRKNKYASDCGAGKEGAGGFQPGNTCGGTGKGDGAEDPKKKKPKKSDTGSGEGMPKEGDWKGVVDQFLTDENSDDPNLGGKITTGYESSVIEGLEDAYGISKEEAVDWIKSNVGFENRDYEPDTGSGEGGKPYGTDSEMRVWLGSEGAYAEGKLVGEWVNASDAPEALESLTKQWQEAGYGDEWAVMDSEGVPQNVHSDIEAIADYANTMESHDNPEALQAYIDSGIATSTEEAVEQFEDRYAGEAGDMSKRGSYDLPMGFVYDLIDDTGGVEVIMENNPGSYVDREKLARDLSYDYSPDVMSREEYADLEGDDPDDLEYEFYVVDGNTEELMFGTDDESTTDIQIDEYMYTLADDVADGGGLSNPDSYFDYEQYAFDLVVGGDIMVSDGYVFWNM